MLVSGNYFNRFFLYAVIGLTAGCINNSKNQKKPLKVKDELNSWKVETIQPKDFVKWPLLGSGRAFVTVGNQTCLEEWDNSEGVMLLSPNYYGKQVIVRYQFLLLSPATVMVTMLSAKDPTSQQITIPKDYKGAMSFWTGLRENYFFVFRNAPHGGTPYITRNPGAKVISSAAEQDGLLTGIYYNVEVGRDISKLWVSINGKTMLETETPEDIHGGHVAVRIRGTAGYEAAVLVKNLIIYSK